MNSLRRNYSGVFLVKGCSVYTLRKHKIKIMRLNLIINSNNNFNHMSNFFLKILYKYILRCEKCFSLFNLFIR